MKPKDELLAKIKATLETSSDELDELTRAKLRAARCRAVEAHRTAPPYALNGTITRLRPYWNLGILLSILILLTLTWVLMQPNFNATTPPTQFSMLEDLDLLGDQEDLEFYENLDFYLWIIDEQHNS